jgi:FkbM family methyltransferase
MIKNFLKKNLPRSIVGWLLKFYTAFLYDFSFKSYSQEGEDMIMRKVFENQSKGVYIDVGAHHPKRFSNTYFFYKRGWSGINIEATPGSMKHFQKIRPRDTNLEAAIADRPTQMRFFMFEEGALNTFDPELAQARQAGGNRVIKEQTIVTVTLAELLKSHLRPTVKIDYMSVDVEGMDLQVLQSNDWTAYRPEFVLVECLGRTLDSLKGDETARFLITHEYELFAKTVNTVIFRDLRAKSA